MGIVIGGHFLRFAASEKKKGGNYLDLDFGDFDDAENEQMKWNERYLLLF